MDLETFRKLAGDRRVIPVSRKLLADGDTPVALYRKLAAERPGTFLLESAENGRSWSRYSFVGVRSHATLTARDGQAHWLGTPPVGVPLDGDPLAALRATIEALHTPTRRACPLHRRHGRLPRLRHRAPPGEDRPRRAGRPSAAGADHAADERPGGHGPLGGLGPADRQRHQPQRPGHGHRRGPRRRRRPPRRHAGRSRPARRPAPGGPAALGAARVHRAVGRPRLPGGRRGHQGAHPGRRGLPGRPLPALRNAVHGKRLGRLPRPPGDQPVPVHVPVPLRRLRRRRFLPEALVKVEDGHAMVHPIAGTRHRGRPRRRTRPSPTSCSPIPRSAPST